MGQNLRVPQKLFSVAPMIAEAVAPVSERLHDEVALGDLLGLECVPQEN